MGVDMRTFASGFSFNSLPEEDLLKIAKKELMQYNPALYKHAALQEMVFEAEDLYELFGAFRQRLVYTNDGEVAATFGNDDRFCDPLPLLQAVRHGVTPGSYYGYTVENSAHPVLIVNTPGGVKEIKLDYKGFYNLSWEATNTILVSHGAVPTGIPRPPRENVTAWEQMYNVSRHAFPS